MAIWHSDSDRALPMVPLGNGNVLLWEEGATLYSFCAGYSSPHLFSMVPDFGGVYHEIETLRLPNGQGMRHRLFYSADVIEMPMRELCDLQITDHLLPDAPVLFRRMDGISGCNFRMSIPSYVRAVYHPSYRFGSTRADTLFLSVPAGTAFDSGFSTLQEQNVALLFSGSLRYDPLDSAVYFGGDLGELCVIGYSDPAELVRIADKLLKAFQSYGEIPSLHPYYQNAFVPDRSSASASLTDTEPLCHLLAMQAASGAVVTSHREPYAVATDLPWLCSLFLQTDQVVAAGKMLAYWTEASERLGFVPPMLACRPLTVGPPQQQDATSEAAYLLATVNYCNQVTLGKKESDLLYRGMRRTFSALMQSFKEGMIPFSLRTQAFDAGLLDRELLFQGSAEATALAICAAEEFAKYCQKNSKKIAKEEKGYLTILSDAKQSYERNFAAKGKICRNAPRLESYTRRPRFIRGVCTLCQRKGSYPLIDTLELDKYGRYLCRRCFATRRGEPEETDPAVRRHAPRATAMAALWMDSPTALAELPRIALPYYSCHTEQSVRLPMREADTDPMILLALQTRKEELIRILEQDGQLFSGLLCEAHLPSDLTPTLLIHRLIEAVQETIAAETDAGMLSALLYDTTMLGARCAVGASAAAALMLS